MPDAISPSTALIAGEVHSAITELLPRHATLGPQLIDGLQLVLIHPAGDNQ